MAFEGSLEELPIEDVLQLLHVSHKTGVLKLIRGVDQAEMVLKNGEIVGCRHPVPGMAVGQALVESGAVGVLDIQQALDTQKAEGDSARPLIQILIESDIIDQATGWRALTNHFQAAISHLMEWESGLFSFTSNDISVLDSFSYIPDEVVHESSVDLRTILRDSARIFDERHKAERTLSFMSEGKGSEGKGSMGARVLSVSADSRYKKNAASMRLMRELMQDPLLPQPELSSPDGANLVENILSHAQADAGQVLSELKETPSQDDTSEESFKFAENQRKKVLFLSQDEELKISMESRCAANHMELVISDDPIHIPKIVSGWLLEGLVPVLVVDLPIPREEHKEWDLHTKVMLSELHWTHPEVSVVIIGASDFESNLTAFELGATTFFPRPTLGSDPEQYKLELRKLEEAIEMVVHADFQRRAVLAHLVLDGRRQMSELKNVIHEMQVMGEEVDGSTLVLRFVADFMDRCILFVTRKQDMLAVSSFGIAGYNIDDITSLRVAHDEDSILRKVISEGTHFIGDLKESGFDESLFQTIGAPQYPTGVLLPLKAGGKTIALIYGDFGEQHPNLSFVDALEVLAAYSTMAFDLALARWH